jgi:hypothetical protein
MLREQAALLAVRPFSLLLAIHRLKVGARVAANSGHVNE